MEVRIPNCWRLYLFSGNCLPVVYLEQEHTENLADLHLCDARRDWPRDGDVPFRAYHDHSQRGRVWSRSYSRRVEPNSLPKNGDGDRLTNNG